MTWFPWLPPQWVARRFALTFAAFAAHLDAHDVSVFGGRTLCRVHRRLPQPPPPAIFARPPRTSSSRPTLTSWLCARPRRRGSQTYGTPQPPRRPSVFRSVVVRDRRAGALAAAYPRLAYARTGKVPIPTTFTGTALNRTFSIGRAARLVRCSQIGMPDASRVEWTGRSPLLVSSMLSESIPTSVAPSSTRWCAASAVRKEWPSK